MRSGGTGDLKKVLLVLFLLLAALGSTDCHAVTPDQHYVESIAAYAVRVKNQGLFPSVALAQSCWETGFGKSLDNLDISGYPIRQYNNVLGKKWRFGNYFEKMTIEGAGAAQVKVVRKFQVYGSLEECFDDYARNIQKNPAYKDKDTSNPEAFIRSIARHYATDNPDLYASGIIRIIKKYNLTKYD